MKKLLSLIALLLVFIVAATACTGFGGNGGSGEQGGGEGSGETTSIEDALSYITAMYSGKYADGTTTASTYSVLCKAPGKNGVIHDVVWTVDSTEITITADETGNKSVINIPAEPAAAFTYTLTATITDTDGTSVSESFGILKVPAFAITSFEDYMKAKEGENVTVQGIVVAMNSVSLGNKRNHLFLADESGVGGYYCYQMTSDPAVDGIEVGMTVRVKGPVSPYDPMQEIKGGTAEIIDSNKKEVPVVDITDVFASGESVAEYVALYVTIKGVTLGDQDLATETSQYLYFSLNGVESYIRTYVTDLPTQVSRDDKSTIDSAHAEKKGYVADVSGVLIFFGKTPYLMPISVDCFTNYVLPERSDAEKLEFEASGVKIQDRFTESTTITLPLAGATYTDVAFSYTSSSEYAVIDENGNLKVTLPKENTEVVITLSATLGELDPVVKEFTFVIEAASTQQFVPEDVKTPAKGTAYKFYLAQNTNGELLYFAGYMSGNYLATTFKADQATDVYLEEVDGGYRLYFMDGETKKYINAYEYTAGKVGVQIVAEPTCVWTFDKDLGVLVTVVCEKTWYLGTYSTYSTMSLSETWRISGDNASSVGVSQFPAKLATMELKKIGPVDVKTPAKDTAYKFYLAQNTNGAVLYFAGYMSGNYLATVTDISKATDVYLEEVDGGYRFYFMDGETKMYINAYEYTAGKVGVQIVAEPTCVWTFDKDLGVLVTVVCEKTWYLGTYSTYSTMSLSETWRISGDNASSVGVSQFPSKLANIGFVVDAEETPEEPGEGGNTGSEGGNDNTGSEGGNDNTGSEGGAPTEGTTAKVVIADYAAANSWTNSTLYDTITVDGVATITCDGTAANNYGRNTGKYYTSGQNWRIYQAEKPSVTITAADGKTIVSVKISYASQNTGVLTLDGANVESDKVVSVNGSTVTFSVGNTGSATNGQARITAIEIIYA